jgi:serine/threonine protein kinase
MGAIIYEMVKGIPPFYQDQEPEFSDSSEGFRELVLSLIEREPSKRLSSFIDMKKCRWLREIDWDKLMRKEYKMPTKLNFYSNYIHE